MPSSPMPGTYTSTDVPHFLQVRACTGIPASADDSLELPS